MNTDLQQNNSKLKKSDFYSKLLASDLMIKYYENIMDCFSNKVEH
jgi:hypothetical protein